VEPDKKELDNAKVRNIVRETTRLYYLDRIRRGWRPPKNRWHCHSPNSPYNCGGAAKWPSQWSRQQQRTFYRRTYGFSNPNYGYTNDRELYAAPGTVLSGG
jgi:hypothetical protein